MAGKKKSTKPRSSKKARIKDLDVKKGAQQVRGGTTIAHEKASPTPTKSGGVFEVTDYGFGIENP